MKVCLQRGDRLKRVFICTAIIRILVCYMQYKTNYSIVFIKLTFIYPFLSRIEAVMCSYTSKVKPEARNSLQSCTACLKS